MKKQHDDFEALLMIDPSGISEQIKKMYHVLNSVEPDELTTIEDHKKYLELLRKFRQIRSIRVRFHVTDIQHLLYMEKKSVNQDTVRIQLFRKESIIWWQYFLY